MHDEQSRARDAGVPTLLLTVLKNIVFVAVASIVDDVTLGIRINKRQHVGDLGIGGEFHRLAPSSHPSLVGGVTRWAITAVIIRA